MSRKEAMGLIENLLIEKDFEEIREIIDISAPTLRKYYNNDYKKENSIPEKKTEKKIINKLKKQVV